MRTNDVIVVKRNGRMEALKPDKIKVSIGKAFKTVNIDVSEEVWEMLTEEIVKKLEAVGTELYTENIHHVVMDTLEEHGYEETARTFESHQGMK